jgi:hypothetical protein
VLLLLVTAFGQAPAPEILTFDEDDFAVMELLLGIELELGTELATEELLLGVKLDEDTATELELGVELELEEDDVPPPDEL